MPSRPDEIRHALLDQACVGRNPLSGEALYTRGRGLHALCHHLRNPGAVLEQQPIPVAQDAQPAGAVRRLGPTVPSAASIIRERNEFGGRFHEQSLARPPPDSFCRT